VLSTPSSRYWLIDLVGIVIFFGIFYALWLGSHALFTPDEGRYSEVAREMIATHDYITPRVNGVAFLDKPILYYWLQASAIHLFGLKEWALRFWPAFTGILGCLATYIAGRSLFNRRTGMLSAIILATCPLYYGAAHYANLDLEVAVLIGNSLLFFITGIQSASHKIRRACLITAYVFAGLAALTKGLIGIVFPAMIIGAWIVLLNRWDTVKKMYLGIGLVIFALITVPWYVLVQQANPEFFEFFFVKQQLARFLTTEHFNNRTSTWFYVPIVLAGIFPWCTFIIQALLQQYKIAWRDRQQHAATVFLLIWLTLIFAFFSIPKSKTIGYILPIFPAIALLIGNYFSHCWDQRNLLPGKISFIVVCFIAATACLLLPRLATWNINPLLIPYLTTNAVIFFTAGVVSLFLLKKKQTAIIFTVLTVTGAGFLLNLSASSETLNQKTIKPLAIQLKSQLQPEDEVVAFYKYFQDLPIYLERRVTIVADWNAPDIALNDNWLRELWYGMPFQDTKAWLIDDYTFWQRWHSGKRLFVFTNPNYYKKLVGAGKAKIYLIAKYNDAILVSNKPG